MRPGDRGCFVTKMYEPSLRPARDRLCGEQDRGLVCAPAVRFRDRRGGTTDSLRRHPPGPVCDRLPVHTTIGWMFLLQIIAAFALAMTPALNLGRRLVPAVAGV